MLRRLAEWLGGHRQLWPHLGWAALVVCVWFWARYSAPEKERVVYQDREVKVLVHDEVKAAETDANAKHFVERLEIHKANGDSLVRTREGDAHLQHQAVAEKKADASVLERVVYKDREVTRDAPRFRVGAMLGVDVRNLIQPPSWGLTFQASFKVPVLNIPAWAGLWGLNSGAGGAAAGVEF